MAQQRWTMEVKVGTWVVLGLVLFVFFLFAIGDLSTAFQPGYTLRVIFDSANGITDGSPVQYAGVEVGKVQAVRIVYARETGAPKVELLARLPSTVKVHADDEAAISTFGLLGEKYLEIRPGGGGGAILPPDGELVGNPPVSTERIMERSNEVLTEFKQALEGLNRFVANPEAGLYFTEALQEARNAAREWKALAQRLNVAMYQAEAGQGSLGKLLYSDDLYLRMTAMIDDLRAHPWKLLTRPKR
ncbi:MAG: MCE family protein, partial [Candidatus Omnitrophica bacterium]|nr:MCE family protein [Candidatus Omnitrophota bacterium]